MGQRDDNRGTKRQAVIDAGLDRLLHGPIELLRSSLNASSLSAVVDISKDTTYRLFADDGTSSCDAIIAAVAEGATNPEWSGFADSADAIAGTVQKGLEREVSYDQLIIDALAANVEAQFRSPGCPVGWILHAAAITASPAWQGDRPATAADAELAHRLLDTRVRFYEHMAGDLLQLMTACMSLIGRRPRRGMDPRQLLALMHSMVDGAVLRMYLEPEVFDSQLVGESVYALAMAFSEDGALNDPRRPASVEGITIFDQMVDEAATSWNAADERTVDGTARSAGVAPEAAVLLFPSISDLADSLVWTYVLGGGSLIDNPDVARSDGHAPGTEIVMIFGLLRRLRDVVDSHPGAMELVRTRLPDVGIGIRAQLELEVAEVIRGQCPGVDPQVTAGELVRSASCGHPGWPAVTSLMRVLGVTPADPPGG